MREREEGKDVEGRRGERDKEERKREREKEGEAHQIHHVVTNPISFERNNQTRWRDVTSPSCRRNHRQVRRTTTMRVKFVASFKWLPWSGSCILSGKLSYYKSPVWIQVFKGLLPVVGIRGKWNSSDRCARWWKNRCEGKKRRRE